MSDFETNPCITVSGSRRRGSEFFPECPAARMDTVPKALDHFLRSELGYGGQIEEIEEADGQIEITIVTRVMNCVDTTHFRGSIDDMRPLLEAYMFYMQAHERRGPILDEVSQKMEAMTGMGNASLATNLAPILVGGALVHTAILMACGITEDEDLERGRQVPASDLVAAIELYYENGSEIPFRDFANEFFVV